MSRSLHADFTVKVLLLGDHSVGKSSLLAQVVDHIPDTSNNGGIQCINFRANSHAELLIPRNRKRIVTKIVDTGGQERFRSITASFYRGAQGCLILFDAENSDTFMNVSKWHEDLELYTSSQPMTAFLVGVNTDSKSKQVTNEQAEELATKLGLQYHQIKVTDRLKFLRVIQELLDVILIHASRLPSVTIDVLDIYPSSVCTQTSQSAQNKKTFNCSC